MRDRLSLFQTDRADPVYLFRQHFILFHTLYRLQQDLLLARQGRLEISPLQIIIHPVSASGGTQLAQPDPLRSYYLDLNHLYETGTAEVDALLRGFWQRLGRRDQRQEALQVLGLADPVDDACIQRRYRELVMQHHPDRGGDTRRLQLLNASIATLLPQKPA